jgi:hypothetical protein
MGVLKHYKSSSGAVMLAFCPSTHARSGAPIVAVGTVAGAVDVNFNSLSQLEVCVVRLNNGPIAKPAPHSP